MPKFKIRLLETVAYTVTVEAEDSEIAKEMACEIWANSENPTEDFDGSGNGVEVLYWEPGDEENEK